MSVAGAGFDIKSEYEAAKKTATAYLQAVGVLNPDGISTHEWREREVRIMRDAIRKVGPVELPSHPFAREAVMLARRFLDDGHNPDILEKLFANEHPVYREALVILKRTILEIGADMPERLQVWEPDSTRVTERWRREPDRNQRIGMVVEAMVRGNDVLVRWDESERNPVLLQGDLQAVRETAGKPLEELSNEYVIESLNRMRARPWRTLHGGKGLTGRDLVELTNGPLRASARVDGIVQKTEVRKHFPNLYATHNAATEDKGYAYSICDAVAEVLRNARQRASYRTVLRAWMAYRDTNLPSDR